MKHRYSLRFAFALLATLAFSGAWAQSPAERATQVLDQLEAGQFEEVVATFDAQMAAQADAGALGQIWASIPAQFGALQARGEPLEARQEPYDVVMIPLQYERGALNAVIAFNDDDQLAGLQFLPAQPEQHGPEQDAHEQHGHEHHEHPAAEPADEP